MARCCVIAASLLALAGTTHAQCPNGAPPPCPSARRAVTPPPQAVRVRRFLLLPFRNVTRKAEQEWLVTGAPLMLAQLLGQFSDIDVVPEERLAAARRAVGVPADAPDAAQLRKLAAETGGWTAVTGNVFATGDRLRITIQSMDAATSRVLVRAETYMAAGADARDAFDTLSVRLLEPTGVPPGASLAAITTRSVDAYRAYARGVELYQRSRYREAESEFTRAVRLDSTFALAWSAIAATAINTGGIQAMVNPMSPAYRAIEQAARVSNRLGPRDAAYIRAVQAFFRGEIRRARRQLDSLLAANPYDLDAAFWVAASQILVPPVDTTVNPARLETSLNRVVRLTEMILERDPRRRMTYTGPILAYGLGAGMWWGDVYGNRREFTSFAAALISTPDVHEVPVLRGDTIALVLRSTFDSLPLEEQARLRQRSADAAWHWAERWLVAGPEDADAHLWASRVAELRRDFDRALEELRIADSIGVQSSMENLAGMRLSLLVLAGRYDDAAAMADSLLERGTLTSTPFLRLFDRRRAYGAAALLIAKRWNRVARMAEAIGAPRGDERVCRSLIKEMVGYPDAALPRVVRRAVIDTVNAHLADVLANPTLAPCADVLSGAVAP